MKKIMLKGTRFVNESGGEIILHGVNVLCRDAGLGHFYPHFEDAFPYFRRMGFNLLRFGIFWNGVEPRPGVYDEAYLGRVKEIVKLAEEYGIYVMLDMHQDLFAQKFIDGAPDWACLDDGLPHPEHCTIWYQAYLESEAIIRAADHFWANAPASDGVGLLDHYSAMWERIAEVFADCVNIIGFEPMNEPFMGSVAREAFGAATRKMLEKNPSFDLSHPESISQEEQAAFMEEVSRYFLEFDRTTLMAFYRRMQEAVAKHSDKPMITGGNIYCSTNIPTGMERLAGGNQIYAPHGYDSVVDSDRYESFSRENVEHLFAEKRRGQDRLGLPTIIGEWGAFPSADFTNDLIRHMNGIVEKNLWGSAYCEYRPGMETDGNFAALCRSYPVETAGELVSYHYEEASHRFQMEFQARAGETRIFCALLPEKMQCSMPGSFRVEPVSDQTCYCVLTTEMDGRIEVLLE